jgi:hypothetical protein
LRFDWEREKAGEESKRKVEVSRDSRERENEKKE